MGAKRWMPVARSLSVVALCFALAGCDSVEITGPTWVHDNQIVTYNLDMEPYYSHANAIVSVVVEIPQEWTPAGWSFSGTIDGTTVQGNGAFAAGDPGNCSKPPPPAGYKRVYAESGTIADLQPGRDQVDAELVFDSGDAEGVHQLTFWVEAVDDDDVVCDGPSPFSLDVHQWERPEWEQLIGSSSPNSPGLGGVPGRFGYRVGFDGFIYTVFRPDGFHNEIWKTNDLIQWVLVREAVEEEEASTLYVFGGRLFMIAYHNPPGVQPEQWELWASDDGIDWELMTVWFDYPQVVIESPQVLSVILRRGEPYDFEYFLTTSSDGSSWSVVGGAPFAAYPEYVGNGVFFDGVVFVGGSDEEALSSERRPKLWRFDGVTVSVIDTSALALDANRSVTSMVVHRDLLHLGTWADLGGEVWWFDGSSTWHQIGDYGLGLPGEGYVRDLANHLGSLFAVVRRDDDGASEIWVADHNDIWSKSDLDDLSTGSFVYLMSATGGELFAASEFELWRRVLLFEDGFETYDTSRWSTELR